MLSSKVTKEIVSNLKGRISKALTTYQSLPKKEVDALEKVYFVVEELFIIRKKISGDIDQLRSDLVKCYEIVKKSKKNYVQKHIVPLLEKITNIGEKNE